MPLDTRAEGVVWLPEHATVRAPAAGFVRTVLKANGSEVEPGELLVDTEDPLLPAHAQVLAFRVQELQARYHAQWVADVAKAQVIAQALAAAEAELARAQEQVERQRVRSPARGRLLLRGRRPARPVGQAGRGDRLRRAAAAAQRARGVPQDRIGLVRERTRGVELRPVEAPGELLHAVVVREVPAASDELPSAALGRAGGGEVAIRPGDERGTRAFDTVFQFELQLTGDASLERLGSRVWCASTTAPSRCWHKAGARRGSCSCGGMAYEFSCSEPPAADARRDARPYPQRRTPADTGFAKWLKRPPRGGADAGWARQVDAAAASLGPLDDATVAAALRRLRAALSRHGFQPATVRHRVRAGARAVGTHSRPAPPRRATDRRLAAAARPRDRAGHRRRQDADRDAGRRHRGAGRRAGARRHRQRLPGRGAMRTRWRRCTVRSV